MNVKVIIKIKAKRNILFASFLFFMVAFICACDENVDTIEEQNTPSVRHSLIEFIPRDGDISGWVRDGVSSETTNYSELYDFIDGAAQRFIDSGFVAAVFQNYRDESGLQLELRIYEMNSAENARKVYDELVPPSIIPWVDILEVGRIDNSALAAYSVEFQYESMFVQIIIYEKSEPSLEIAKLFALHVMDLMTL
jgi:hypothetical protein